MIGLPNISKLAQDATGSFNLGGGNKENKENAQGQETSDKSWNEVVNNAKTAVSTYAAGSPTGARLNSK